MSAWAMTLPMLRKKGTGRWINIARIAKAALHMFSRKSSSNDRSVCPVYPVCPMYHIFPVCCDDHEDHEDHDDPDDHADNDDHDYHYYYDDHDQDDHDVIHVVGGAVFFFRIMVWSHSLALCCRYQLSRVWWFQKFVGSWQINGFWAWLQFVSTAGSVVYWAMFLSMLVKANVPPVGGAVWLGAAPPWSSLQVDDVFYPCLKYLPHLVKTIIAENKCFPFTTPCILTAKNKFLFFEGASPCLFFLGENLNAKDPADASWARMDQGKSPIWARTSPSLRAPGFPHFFGLLSFSSPYPPTKKWK